MYRSLYHFVLIIRSGHLTYGSERGSQRWKCSRRYPCDNCRALTGRRRLATCELGLAGYADWISCGKWLTEWQLLLQKILLATMSYSKISSHKRIYYLWLLKVRKFTFVNIVQRNKNRNQNVSKSKELFPYLSHSKITKLLLQCILVSKN